MSTIIYPQGSVTVTVPDGEKIAIFSYSSLTLLQEVGYPNFPSTWDTITVTADGDTYTSAAFTGDTVVQVQTSAADGFYSVGAAPVVGAPSPDITFAASPGVIAGVDGTQGGSATIKGGTSSTSANAGGAAAVLGGQPGATGVGGAANVTGGAGGATSGTGGAANITGGAGTNGNANGGAVVITGGAANGSGFAGAIIERGVRLISQGTPTAKTVSATLTAAELRPGIITVNQGGAGASALQMPDATAMSAGFPNAADGDAFDFSLINISTVAAEDASITTNTGWTLVGDMDVASNAAATDKSAGRFRARRTGATAWTLYRLS